MLDIIKKFNEFFGDNAKIEIKDNNLYINIDKQTLMIQLPYICGASCEGKKEKP